MWPTLQVNFSTPLTTTTASWARHDEQPERTHGTREHDRIYADAAIRPPVYRPARSAGGVGRSAHRRALERQRQEPPAVGFHRDPRPRDASAPVRTTGLRQAPG